MKKRLFPLIAALVLFLATAVSAHEIPDLTQNGSITFELSYEGEAVDGGTLALYRVGDITEYDGNYSFALVPELAGSGLSLDDLQSAGLAAELAELARKSDIEPITAPVTDGTAAFTDVQPGLYLVVQPDAAEGFAPLNPFLISVPRYENGTYVTDVTARPKVPMETEPKDTEPTEPSEPTPTDPTTPVIPKTGQLNWPVPMLAALGLTFFVLGWILVFGYRREQREA